MNKSILALLFLCLSGQCLFAQDITKDFEIELPKHKVANSLYSSISYMNSRHGDTSMIGVVDVGPLKNIEAKLVFKTPLQNQLTAVLDALTDSTAQSGELLFQLIRFHFTETDATRYCYLIAALYAKASGGYKKLAVIDTMLVFNSAVSNILIKEESKQITGFIEQNLLKRPADTAVYSLNEVANIDSIEKQKMPLYTTTAYKEGLYENYQSFMSQVPDKQAFVRTDRDGNIASVKILDDSGSKVRLRPKNVYAIVYKGQPFIATRFGYYTLLRAADNNFYFTGEVRVVASQEEIGSAFAILPLIPAVVASTGNSATYVMMLDYRKGAFIRLRKIVKPLNP